jgi:hypothetical protein
MGSVHDEVFVHLLRPPSSAATILNSESTVERKGRIALAEEAGPAKVERLRDILNNWRQGSQPRTVADCSALFVAAAPSDEDGFIAALTLDGERLLVVGDSRTVTCDLDDQLRVCGLALHSEADVAQHAVRDAVDSIHRWCGTQRAAAAAGVVASHASGRRELIARIDLSIEAAPPHQRSARLALADRARKVVTSPQCAEVERDLETILHARLTQEEWLAAVANLDTQQAIRSVSDVECLSIHAILLLTLRQPRSQPRPDRGYP